MQIAVVALLVLSVSVFETGGQTAEPCIPEPMPCNRLLAPVCGSNGVTYDNDCILDNDRQCNPSLRLDYNGCCDNEKGRRKCRGIMIPPVF